MSDRGFCFVFCLSRQKDVAGKKKGVKIEAVDSSIVDTNAMRVLYLESQGQSVKKTPVHGRTSLLPVEVRRATDW